MGLYRGVCIQLLCCCLRVSGSQGRLAPTTATRRLEETEALHVRVPASFAPASCSLPVPPLGPLLGLDQGPHSRTLYEDGLYLFDIQLPNIYPPCPPTSATSPSAVAA